ncbi:MAG: hypothetical protein IJU76_08150 [Desulfovibrionaceae bacterium]|nr:hypothetical protein [Desulfovibrionaceae bacterium]
MTCVIEACDDAVSYDFCKAEMHTARKEHHCYECGRIIKKGEKYEYARGVWEGDFSTNKTCLDCLSLRNTYFCSWLFGDIWEEFRYWLHDWWLYDGQELWKLEALTPAARERALKYIEEWEEDDDV